MAVATPRLRTTGQNGGSARGYPEPAGYDPRPGQGVARPYVYASGAPGADALICPVWITLPEA
jgi:hypothetical protein